MHLSYRIIIGLVLGVAAGLIAGPLYAPFLKMWVAPIGTLFINLIKMIIVPVVLASVICGTAALGDVKRLGRLGAKVMSFYFITTASAVALGLLLTHLMQPGKGLILPTGEKVVAKEAPAISQLFFNIVPPNPFQAMVNADVLQVIVFALIIGIGITLAGERAKPVEAFFSGLAAVTYKLIDLIMQLAPIGVFALIMPAVAVNGAKVLLPLASVIAVVYIGCLLHMTFVYSGLVSILGGMSPARFFKGVFPAMLVAFSTCSSSAAVPINIKCTQENLGVNKDVSAFCLPIGSTVNMDGTALYQGVCALFVAQVYGVELSMAHYVTIVLTATLASIGTAGVPGAGLIMLTLVLQSVGLPLEGIALVAGIDRILDMIRTTVNITGDAAACVVIHKNEP